MTEKAEQDALDALRKAYFDEVREWAADFDKRIDEGEWDDRESFMDALDQEVDGSQRVIYTFQARTGLLCSNNDDAYFEELGDYEGAVSKDGIEWSKLMFFAFRADILERMESDVDDDDTFAEDEDEEEDDED